MALALQLYRSPVRNDSRYLIGGSCFKEELLIIGMFGFFIGISLTIYAFRYVPGWLHSLQNLADG
jgi:hypothetical protein